MDKNFRLIEKLQEDLKNNPNNVELLNNIAVCYFRIKNLKKAEFYYKKALIINPNNINILNNLGILKQTNSPKEAIPLYKKILSINKDIFETKYNLSLGRSNGAAPVPAAGLPELKNVVDPLLADPK